MRTTLTLDDSIAQALKERAHRSGQSFKETVNETLRKGLSAPPAGPRRRWVQRTASLGGPAPGVDLTRALALASALEDEETARELERRK